MKITRYLRAFGAAGLVAGCVSAPARRHDLARSAPTMAPSNVLTAADLSHFPASEMLLGALQLLRPEFLGTRRSTPAVFIDGLPLTLLSDLGVLPASSILVVTLVRGSV